MFCERVWSYKIDQNIEVCRRLVQVTSRNLFIPLNLNKTFKTHCVERVQISSFSSPYFPLFSVFSVSLFAFSCIQSKYRKIRSRKNSIIGHFSCSDQVKKSSKIEQNQKTFSICFCATFYRYYQNLKRRLGTRLWLHPISTLFSAVSERITG